MSKFFRKIFDIREGEEVKALLMFIYIFLIIASLLIVKPVRNSLFLTKFGISQLPIAFILVAVIACFITNIYSRWIKKVRLNLLIYYSALIFIGCLIAFWMGLYFDYQVGWFFYTFYVWVALFGVIATSQFWLLANYVFNAREAKRLFGFVGAGAISGGIFGGYLTKFLAPLFGTENMIFFCIFFLIICIFILKQVWKKGASYNYKERLLQEQRISKKHLEENIINIFKNSKHICYIAGIIGVSVVVANLVDYQYSAIVSEHITNEDQLTAFFGFWLSNLSIASLFIQFFLTGRVLKFFGVTTSLFFLPVGILIGAVSILVSPVIGSAVLIKVSEGGFKQSINKAGLELLVLPLPGNIKNQGKAVIDVFIDSLATGIGGILLLIFTSYVGLPVEYISIIVISVILIWIYLIIKVRDEYINSFRLALEKGSIDLNEQSINLQDASVFQSLLNVLKGRNEKQILYVLQLIENVKNDQFIPYFQEILKSKKSEIIIQVLRIIRQYDASNFIEHVKTLIPDKNIEVKIAAIEYLLFHSNNDKSIILNLLENEDIQIRSAALICAAQACREQAEFRKNIDLKKLFDNYIERCCSKDNTDDEKKFMKKILARVIGTSEDPQLYPFLKNMLYDECPDVLKTAIRNAGTTGNKIFIPLLISHLKTNSVKKDAREALAGFGEEVISTLAEYLENSNKPREIRMAIPKVLAMIDSQKSVNLLINNLEQSDLLLRHEIIKALNKLKAKYTELKFNKQYIMPHIINETKYYYRLLNLLYQQNNSLPKTALNSTTSNGKAIIARKLLVNALKEKLQVNMERIFRLLGLKYIPNDMYNAYLGIVSEKPYLRANAIEFLDNILDITSKRMIIPIVEENSTSFLIDKSQQLFGYQLPKEQDTIEFLLDGKDNWLKVCTLYFIAEMKYSQYKNNIKLMERDNDPIVRETVQYYLNSV